MSKSRNWLRGRGSNPRPIG